MMTIGTSISSLYRTMTLPFSVTVTHTPSHTRMGICIAKRQVWDAPYRAKMLLPQ